VRSLQGRLQEVSAVPSFPAMSRVLSLAFVALLAAGLFLLPNPEPERLAALACGDRLNEQVEGRGAAAPMLWEALLDSPAATRADGRVTIHLGALTGVDGQARGSVVRALRAILDGEGYVVEIDGAARPSTHPAAAAIAVEMPPGALRLRLAVPGSEPFGAQSTFHPPRRSSLLPPLFAIFLAILFRRPVLALFCGVLLGSVLAQMADGAGAIAALGPGALDVFRTYFANELVNSDRIKIMLFVLFMLAMVGVMTRAGGLQGLMDWIARTARDARRTQVAAWLMGLAVFFDDYANTILVGTTMRPLTDRFRVAREKLAYIVDSTAAPVAGLSIFSTWIAFEVSTFSAQLPDAGLAASEGYSVFLRTLPYRFYCIFTLAFVGFVVLLGRDFGPMLVAERRARAGKVLRDGAKPMIGEAVTALAPAPGVAPWAARALVPLLVFLLGTLVLVLANGGAFTGGAFDEGLLRGLAGVLNDGDALGSLAWASGAGLVVAVAMAVAAGLRGEILGAAWTGVRSMAIAIAILYLAWMIGAVCGTLGTAPYLTVLVGDALPAAVLPAILFVLAGVVAFSTGSSWSTMSILLPLVVGLAFGVGEAAEVGYGIPLMILSIGAVLEGAIFGDHCSPISDTTVMSSIASASDHIDHVRTQAPYAVLTMVVALLVGYLPCAFLRMSPFLGIALGLAVLAGSLFVVGREVEPHARAVTGPPSPTG